MADDFGTGVCVPSAGCAECFLPLFAGSDGVRVVSYMRCTLYQSSTKVIVFSFVVGSLFKKTYIFGVNGGFAGNPFRFHRFLGIMCPAVLHHTHTVRNLQQSFSMRSRHPLPAFGKKGQGMS